MFSLSRSLSSIAVLALACGALIPQTAQAQTATTVDDTSRGAYSATGSTSGTSGAASGNYIAGSLGFNNVVYRNFFIFSIPALSAGQSYTAASFSFNSAGFSSAQGMETLSLRSIDSTSYAALTAGTAGASGYNDLGDGSDFSSALVTASNTVYTVALPASALSVINQDAGNQFGFGGFISTIDNPANSELIGGNSGATSVTQLSLTASVAGAASAPEPGSIALLALAGLPVVGAITRRRRS